MIETAHLLPISIHMSPSILCKMVELVPKLIAIDYVSKWVEALPCRAVDARHARKIFHEVIFPRFGTPRMVISDGDLTS